MNKAVATATKASLYAKAKDDDKIKKTAIKIMVMSKVNGKKNGETIDSPDTAAVVSEIKLHSIMGNAKPLGSSRATLNLESIDGRGILKPNPYITKMAAIAVAAIE